MATTFGNSTRFNTAASAQATDTSDLLTDVALQHWKVDKNKISYRNAQCHTLSMYLRGGETSYRIDHAAEKGSPGKLCLLPQDQDSKWQINGEIDFVHLYFSDEMLRRFAATTFDADARFVELRDLLYEHDETLRRLFLDYATLCNDTTTPSPLLAEQAMNKLLHHLLKHYNGFVVKDRAIVGGLAPFQRRRVKDLIHQKLAARLSIDMLASEVNLSPFHFARMFKMSFGDSPASYITRTRVDRVKTLLERPTSLARISDQAGFSQQSHMTRHFKKLTGLTPAVYRRHLTS